MLFLISKLIIHPRGIYFIILFYFLIAILFSFLYHYVIPFIENHDSLLYTVSVQPANYKINYVDCLYFSITSQATVGYGDLIPITNTSKVLVSIQVFFGYFYLCFAISIFTARTMMRSKKLAPLLRFKNTLIE